MRTLSKLIVVKFGGSVLRDGDGIRVAAEQIKSEVEKGNRVVAVVSALKGVTDQLPEASAAISPSTPVSVKDHIVRLGEEQSTRLVSSALNLIGVSSEELTVDSPGWPVITDDTFGDTEPILEECRKAVKLSLEPLIGRGVTPVVSGFVGRSQSGEVTTLGRGGTDTTATVLANCLEADELILVKDVGGVYTSDPNKVKEAKKLDSISMSDAQMLSSSGAKVVHDKVFRYRSSELGIRLISTGEDLSGSGTLIEGSQPEIEVTLEAEPVHLFTLVGENLIAALVSDAVDSITSVGGTVINVEMNQGTLSLVSKKVPQESLVSLHKLVKPHGLTGISVRENLRKVSVSDPRIHSIREKLLAFTASPAVHSATISKTGASLILYNEDSLEETIEPILELVISET